MKRRILEGLLIGLAASLLALLAWHFGALTRLEARTWDLRVAHLWHREKPSDRIRLVFLDQGSLDWAKEQMHWPWPWPREVYGPLIGFPKQGGDRAIAFDVMYTEPSASGVEDDNALGAAIAAASNFVGAVFLGHENGSATNWPAAVPDHLNNFPDWASKCATATKDWRKLDLVFP